MRLKRFRLLLILPVAFVVGWKAPPRLFLPLVLVLMVGAFIELVRSSEQKGYWKAHVELSDILDMLAHDESMDDGQRWRAMITALVLQTSPLGQSAQRRRWWIRG